MINCVSAECENIPATTIGVYDGDGKNVYPDTAYCAECTEIMAASGDYVVTRNLDPELPKTTVLILPTEIRALERLSQFIVGWDAELKEVSNLLQRIKYATTTENTPTPLPS